MTTKNHNPLLMAISFSVLIVPTITQRTLSAQSTVLDQEGSGVVDRRVLVRPDEFEIKRIREFAKRFVEEVGARHWLSRLTLAVDEATLSSCFGHHSTFGGPEAALAQIERSGVPQGRVARVISINGVTLLSIRDHGDYFEEVLSGSTDPTLIRGNQEEYKLLHFRLVENRAPTAPQFRYFLNFFLKANGRMSASSAISITETLRKMSNAPSISVRIRPDEWFIEDEEFPSIFPFLKQIALPSLSQYVLSSHIACSSVPGAETKCSGTNFLP